MKSEEDSAILKSCFPARARGAGAECDIVASPRQSSQQSQGAARDETNAMREWELNVALRTVAVKPRERGTTRSTLGTRKTN